MKKYSRPDIEIIALDVTDIITASQAETTAPAATSAEATAAPTTAAPTTIADPGLDNEVSAKIWEF